MDLQNFITTIFTEDIEVVKIVSALINGLKTNDINEKVILHFFEKIPTQFKNNKKLCEHIFTDFFNTYAVNENNISYYDKYIEDNYHKLTIIAKNPDWKWEKTVFEYKTLKDLVNNYEAAHYRSGVGEKFEEDGLKFINENKESFQRFSKANKKKFQQMLIKKGVFKFLQQVDYEIFKNFCVDNDLSSLEILKEMYIKPYSDTYEGYGFKGFLMHTKNKNFAKEELVHVLNDITENRELLFGNTNQFFNIKSEKSFYKDNENHISLVFMEWILEDRFDLAIILTQYFKTEVLEGLNFFGAKAIKEKTNDINTILLKSVTEVLQNLAKRDGSFAKFQYLNDEKLGNFENNYNQEKKQLKSNAVKNKF
jgi:hypothetical protein